MKIAELWRYPVKSMAGERIQRSRVEFLGLPGDRIVHVENGVGRVITSRSHPRLLGHHATLNAEGEPLVDGDLWSGPEPLRKVTEIVGSGAKFVHDETADRFDVLPLLIATDGAIAAFGRDHRRLRPNIVISGVDGLAERQWPTLRLRMGTAIIGVQSLRSRCVMTTYDPDTQRQDPQVLKDIVQRFGGKLALDCYIIEPGEIHVGDEVELVHPQQSTVASSISG